MHYDTKFAPIELFHLQLHFFRAQVFPTSDKPDRKEYIRLAPLESTDLR